LKKTRSDYPRVLLVLQELTFWILSLGVLGMIVLALYVL